MTGAEIVRSSYRTRRVTTWALTTFAALAQLLGMVGLYGLVWQTHRMNDLWVISRKCYAWHNLCL